MEKIIVGVFVSCLFIMWSTARAYATLRSIQYELKRLREQMKKDGDNE